MMDAIIGRAPFEVMDDQNLRDGISFRTRWALDAAPCRADDAHEADGHANLEMT